MDENLISSLEAARLLDVSSEHVRKLARAGVLPVAAMTRGGRVYWRADVERVAAERQAARDGR
jgi:excisionase family DNA binding protein